MVDFKNRATKQKRNNKNELPVIAPRRSEATGDKNPMSMYTTAQNREKALPEKRRYNAPNCKNQIGPKMH